MSISLRDTIVPKSDQLNSEQLLSGPMTVTVTAVDVVGGDQPVIVHYRGENGRPFKPCKSMRKVMIFAWGDNDDDWIGRSMTLFNDTEVKWAGEKVGGVRISHMSHIEKNIELSLTATRGKKSKFVIQVLRESRDTQQARASLETAAQNGMDALVSAWKATPGNIRAEIGPNGCPENLKSIAASVDAKKVQEMPEIPVTSEQPEEDEF